MTTSIRLHVAVAAIVCTAFLSWIAMPTAVAAEESHEKHDDGEEHVGEREAGELGDHDEEQIVRLSADEIKEFGIRVAAAGPGKLEAYVEMPGEVVIDPDRLAHVVPRVGGVAREVKKKLGDFVRAAEILAVIESRELSELKSGYLVARERTDLAAATFVREEKLWKEEISSEKEYLEAEQDLAEARIETRAAEQKLHALGFSEGYTNDLTFAQDELFTRYEVTAPFDGRIVEKHITYGEMIKDDAEAFVIVDLSSVWALFTVYQTDVSRVKRGQSVHISAGDHGPSAVGSISYISPLVDEATRTTKVRVVLPNLQGRWRPGSFVSGKVAVAAIEVRLLAPKSAVQIVDGQRSVFVETEEGFQPRPVEIGRTNETQVEINAGLLPGQRYVSTGAFTLKAQLAKSAFGDGHGH